MSSTPKHERSTPKWPVCDGVNRFGTPCKARAIKDGKCSVHAGISDPSLMGKKSRETVAARRAHENGGPARQDSVREELRKEGFKRKDEIAAALARGLNANDPTVAVRSAQAFLSEAFGRVGTASADEAEPSRMVTGVFRRPAYEGEPDRLYAVMRDGRILQVSTLSFDEPDPGANGPH